MNSSDIPDRFIKAFGVNGDKNAIPTNSSTSTLSDGAATFDSGFPPLTMTAISAGGIPPDGKDVNGIFYSVTLKQQWSDSGMSYPFNADFSTAIGGYPKGAVIPFSTLDGSWLNTINNNSSTPENNGSTSSGWVPSFSYGSSSVVASGSSNITLTSLQASRPSISITGTITSNIYLFLPSWVKTWKITNNTIGGFSIACKTASGSSTATIYPGGSAIVRCDGTNVFFELPSSGASQSGGMTLGNGIRMVWGYTDGICSVSGIDGIYETENIVVTPSFSTSEGAFGFNLICSVQLTVVDVGGAGQNENAWLMDQIIPNKSFAFRASCKTQNATIRTRWLAIGF